MGQNDRFLIVSFRITAMARILLRGMVEKSRMSERRRFTCSAGPVSNTRAHLRECSRRSQHRFYSGAATPTAVRNIRQQARETLEQRNSIGLPRRGRAFLSSPARITFRRKFHESWKAFEAAGGWHTSRRRGTEIRMETRSARRNVSYL